ncbi:hypothetical protein [Caldalkalibacillus salinus]|uniref:hypothetical protein n=1 Tax=Caldalkalibacillus salinus TaxID=2803787 RepID=UPI0019205B7D|nr:hypothetical protein [Caldalkalibacillus salinus]
MSRHADSFHPCVKIKSPIDHQDADLKELAKKLAQRKVSSSENPSIKRLQQRFEKI